MHTTRALLVASLLLFACSATLAADPCVLPPNTGNAWVGSLTKLKDCFTQVPIQTNPASATISALRSLADLYSFTDISVNSGPPYNIQVDLMGGLSQIQNKLANGGYQNDYAFHSDVMNLFNPLFDAHTLYRAPAGYQCFFLRPFNIEASYSNGAVTYTLRPGPLGAASIDIWKNQFNFDITPLLNQVVTNINGMTVTDHLMVVAQNFISTYKDHGVRYNAALRQRWAQTVLSMFPITSSSMDFDSTITLASGQTFTVPNAGFCGNGGIRSTSDLLSRNRGMLSEMKSMRLKEDILIEGVDVHREMRQMFEDATSKLPPASPAAEQALRDSLRIAMRASEEEDMKPKTIRMHDMRKLHATHGREFLTTENMDIPVRELPANFDSSYLTLVSKTAANDTYFMKYNDGVHPPTWILKLTTFAPIWQPSTIEIFQEIIQDAKNNLGTHLIVDVAYNGGGLICLSDFLLAILVPDWVSLQPGAGKGPTVPYGIYDYKQSNTALAFRANSFLNRLFTSNENYLDTKTQQPASTDFFNPILRTRGGRTSNYTQQAYFPAACVGYPSSIFKPIPYYFKSITVLTDGTCGSACALFSSQLQSENYATVVSYGGPLGRTVPLSTASFAGGNVLDYQTVATYAATLGGGAPGLPPLLPSTALARFNFNEYYELTDLNTPREFLKRPAHIHLDYYATMFEDRPTTPQGLANNAALYAAVIQAQ